MSGDKKKTILLVEDEIIIAMAEKMTLEKYGYNIVTAITGEQAVDIISKQIEQQTHIDLILMDIDLGYGIDGTQAAQMILEKYDIPIVFLSSHSEPEIVGKTENITSYGYVVKNSGITVLDASIKMAFKLFEAKLKEKEKEEALQLSEQKFSDMVTSSPGMVYQFRVEKDNNINFTYMSPNAAELFGFPNDSAGSHWNPIEYLHPDDVDAFITVISKSINDVVPHSFEGRLVTVKGIIWFLAIAHPVIKNNELLFNGIITDITEQKYIENELREKVLQYHYLADSGLALIWTAGTDSLCNYFNVPWLKFTGRTLEQELGTGWIEGVHPDDVQMCMEIYQRAFDKQEIFDMNYRLRHASGEYRWIRDMGTPIYNSKNEFTGYIGHCFDITRQKTDEETIKSLLAEKELILKEVHHRIKNNMCTIQAVLQLQAGSVNNPVAASILNDAGKRVQSMIVLYNKLYHSDDFKKISVKDYFPDLIDQIIKNFPNSTTVQVDKTFDDIVFDTKKAQPIGIIINELLTNIMKYAFVGKDSGTVSVSVSMNDGRACVVVQDNGVGMPPSITFENSTGFGLQLVWMLTQQLRGDIRIERDYGTKIVLEFQV